MEVDQDNLKKHIESLYKFNKTPDCGCTRYSYSNEDRMARQYLNELFDKMDLQVITDSVGNIHARTKYSGNKLPVVMIGSHIDTVHCGGKYDGVVGVVGALEALRTIIESKVELSIAVELVVFAEEEGSNFNSTMLGSKAMIGKFTTTDDLKRIKTEQGISWYKILQDFGLNPDSVGTDSIRGNELLAMIELHIEQGIRLEHENKTIGIVEAIAGMKSLDIVVRGISNHAGTTPMSMRKDPMGGAAEVILAIEKIAADSAGAGKETVATVGKISCLPNASNVIPEKVCFSLDIRDVEDENISKTLDMVKQEAGKIEEARGLRISFNVVGESDAVILSEKIVRSIEGQAERMGIPFMRMSSGAVHDAAMISKICDVGMIFIPSKNGISHSSGEFTEYSHIKLGSDLLLQTVLDINSRVEKGSIK